MSKKSDLAQMLLEKIELQWPLPEPVEGASLLEQGMYAVLLRRLEPRKARSALAILRERYQDWNELRVAQAQEIADQIRVGREGVAAGHDVRAYLQEVFQRSHGMDLEFLREDPQASARFASQLPFLGLATAHYVLWLADQERLPVTPALMRVLDRIGLIPRTASPRKARASLEPLVGERGPLDFAVRFGEVASRWCDPRKPVCHLCVLVEDCRYGKKAFREWRVQQERLEVQRAREAARQAALQKKEDERRRREEERRAKKEAADRARAEREAERRARADARKREAEEKKRAREKARQDAAKKREEQKARAAEARRKAEAKKTASKPTRATPARGAKKPSTKKGARKKKK